jgi:hypothetical protein
MTVFHTTRPNGSMPVWLTPERAHTDSEPFCGEMGCICHYQYERVERYVVEPVERGEIDIPTALDRYYCRQPVLVG